MSVRPAVQRPPRFLEIPAIRRFTVVTREAFHPTCPEQPFGSISRGAKVEVTAACDRRRRIDPRWLGHVAFFGLVKDLAGRIEGAEVSKPVPAWTLPAPAVDGPISTAFHLNSAEQVGRLADALTKRPSSLREIGASAIHITCPLSALQAVDPFGQIKFNLQSFGECVFHGGDLPKTFARSVFFHVEDDSCTITIPAPAFCEAAYASNPDLHPRKVAFVPGKIPFGDIFDLLIYGYRHLGLMSEFGRVHGKEREHPVFLALHDLFYHMAHLVQVPHSDIERVADFISDCIEACPYIAHEMELWPRMEPPADAYAGRIAPERSPLYQLNFIVRPFIESAMAYMMKWGIAEEDYARLLVHSLVLELGLHATAKTWRPPDDWMG